MSHPFSRGRGAVAAGLAASIAALPALAQEAYTGPADTFSLGEITLQVLGTQPVGALTDPLTLTGAKTATAVTEIPQSVSIVSAGRMAETNAAKIDEALRFTSGVQAAPYAYDSDTNWFFLRGFDATASGVFLDGAQLYSYAFGGFYIDPFLIERIEVLKGPSSMLYGASNPGGVVNYVSRLPGANPAAWPNWASTTRGGAGRASTTRPTSTTRSRSASGPRFRASTATACSTTAGTASSRRASPNGSITAAC